MKVNLSRLFGKSKQSEEEHQALVDEAMQSDDLNEVDASFETDALPHEDDSEEEKILKEGFKISKELGLFNLEWYQAHCGVFPTEYSAFKDYCAKSTFSNVNPSAQFDTEGYLRSHQDIYHAGESPLLHYVFNGRHEGRRKFPVISRWTPKTELLAQDTAGWETQKIAICLHIFYPDFIDKFAQCLASFPLNVDVFVAVSDAGWIEQVKERYSGIPSVQALEVVAVPNQGRNFGPLLVEFGSRLLNYDLMCHLHSKKSLYSGREQTQWFDYLNQYLFKDQHVVNCLLRLFAQNENLGMYYPTSFWMMPSWVNHWTCNKPHATEFVNHWGISLEQNFINYPVGGMFWARPAALKQLLETQYQYADFPAEPLPNDGSWLHALERAIGLLVEKNGFEQFYYYPPAAKFTDDPSYKMIGYHKPPEQLARELRNFEVVSFDIFDTLIRRKYTEPDYAKYLVGKHLVENELIGSADAFVKLRNETEHKLRAENAYEGDVDINQVYTRLSQILGLDIEQGRNFLELEFQYDADMMLAKDEMLTVLHDLADLGREIWLVSDTYYTAQQIETLLKNVGVAANYRLFVSSELQKRKDTGAMWQHIKEILDETEQSYIHVGDNVRSDAQLCGDYGFTNMHILHPVDKWQAAELPAVRFTVGDHLNESAIVKWGRLIANHGRYPFFGE